MSQRGVLCDRGTFRSQLTVSWRSLVMFLPTCFVLSNKFSCSKSLYWRKLGIWQDKFLSIVRQFPLCKHVVSKIASVRDDGVRDEDYVQNNMLVFARLPYTYSRRWKVSMARARSQAYADKWFCAVVVKNTNDDEILQLSAIQCKKDIAKLYYLR